MTIENRDCKVCVTGGSGFIGSFLIKQLLQNGYTVHTTVRNLEDSSKTSVLKSLPHSESRLVLFQADIYNPNEFEPAIQNCEYVFHLATPMEHNHNSQYKDTAEAAVAGVRSIADSCIRLKSVKRLIYTASVMALSPLKENGNGYGECIDESCWTPSHVPFAYSDDVTLAYTKSKTLAEKELLKYNEIENSTLEVVTMPCALVGGDTLLSYAPSSIQVILSHVTGSAFSCQAMKFLQELLASIPLAHVDDVCRAHIFCMEQPFMKGRFLCVAANPTLAQIATFYQDNYPEFVVERLMEEPQGGIRCDATKLMKMGFRYNYDMKNILRHTLECGIRLGFLPSQVNDK